MTERQSVTMEAVQQAVAAGLWAMTSHAHTQAGQRHVDSLDLVGALAGGEMLEGYPLDPRGPSALVLGYTAGRRPLHAVCAFDPGGALLVITVYEPQPPRWLHARTRAPRSQE